MFSSNSAGSDSVHAGHGHDSMMSMSPASPPMAYPPSHSSPFLPGYLLGDQLSHHQTTSSPRLWSSGGSHSPSAKSHSTPLGSGLTRRDSSRKVGAPPVKSLYSGTSTDGSNTLGGFPLQGNSQSSPALRQMSVTASPAPPTSGLFQTPGGSRGDTSLQNLSQALPVSPAQADPFYTQGDLKSDDQLDGTWVTVFGFPPGATSFILQQFSQYGTILKHVVATECNWMHIHYLNRIQAKKALSKDGKVYGGCMKIGVTACIEKAVMEDKENLSLARHSMMDNSMTSPSDTLNASKHTPIRPLTAAYVASRGEYEVLKDRQTPKRDAGLVCKLKEYMFG